MKHLSYWEKDAFKHHDIVVVGAGIVGTITAIECKIKFPKRKIALIERSTLPKGASTKNAGFACFGSISEMYDDLKKSSEEKLINLISTRWEGLQKLQSYFKKHEIADLEFNGGYEIFVDPDEFNTYQNKLEYFNEIVCRATKLRPCFEVVKNDFGFECHEKLFLNRYEGQLNPLKMLKHLTQIAIKKGVNLFYGMTLLDWQRDDGIRLRFKEDQHLFCDQLIIATNAFTNKLVKKLDLKPYRNQVLITRPIADLKIKGTFHFNKGYTYFRNVGKRILLGGFRDIDMETEHTEKFGLTDKIQEKQEDFLKEVLGIEAFVEHRWSGIIATGNEKEAIVKEIEEDVFLAVRLGGMGIAIGAQIAHQAVDLIH